MYSPNSSTQHGLCAPQIPFQSPCVADLHADHNAGRTLAVRRLLATTAACWLGGDPGGLHHAPWAAQPSGVSAPPGHGPGRNHNAAALIGH